MKRLDIRSHLEDILENARLAKELVGTMSYEAFSQDIRTRLAVERTIEIIGEATKRVPVEVRAAIRTYRGEGWPGCEMW